MDIKLIVGSMDLSPAMEKAAKFSPKLRSTLVRQARSDTERFVPILSGDLRGTAHSESQEEAGLLIYGSGTVPYARYQYYGEFQHPHGGQRQWFEASKAQYMAAWEKLAQVVAAKEFNGR